MLVTETNIPGLLVIDLDVHSDARGWFKENWQREKMLQLGLPDFEPVQNNVSFNEAVGVTRGIHAEPWDKFVGLTSGRVFAAWVDLREGETFGKTFNLEFGPEKAVFVPRGVGNSYQTLEPNTAYTYLVNEHWTPEAKYAAVALDDSTLNIAWPIALDNSEVSEKDKHNPKLEDAQKFASKKTLIIGNGQLGRELRKLFPAADATTRDLIDFEKPETLRAVDWASYSVVINAAAFTSVDQAEVEREKAWQVNAHAVGELARITREHRITLVHISSDYVFDGKKSSYSENDLLSPLGVYGQTKAAADLLVAGNPKHYVIRTSWVMGDGSNFVSTMQHLAQSEVNPLVVNDQIGRPTFTQDLAEGIAHLLASNSPFGTYNLSCEGEPTTWAEIAKLVFESTGHDSSRVIETSTEAYAKENSPFAPRPQNSILDLNKIESTGFKPRDWKHALKTYLG